MKFQRGPAGDSRNRTPRLGDGEAFERVRARIDMRGATPDMILRDAERAQARHPNLKNARYLGVSNCYHAFAYRQNEAHA